MSKIIPKNFENEVENSINEIETTDKSENKTMKAKAFENVSSIFSIMKQKVPGLIFTIHLTLYNSIFSFKGSLSFLNILGIILAPIKSCA